MRSRKRLRSRTPRIDLTPLLDAIFLIIVLLLCSFIHMRMIRTISIDRPVVSSASSLLQKQDILPVTVTEDGQILLDGTEVTIEELGRLLAESAQSSHGCLISADRKSYHGRVTEVFVAAKKALPQKPIYFEVSQPRS